MSPTATMTATPEAAKAVADYCREVREGAFPGPEHSFTSEK